MNNIAPKNRFISCLKVALFFLCCTPLVVLVWRAYQNELGANPVEMLIRNTGFWALNFLWFTLAITPLRRLTGWGSLMRFRRMLGLFVFFYALVHGLMFIGLEHSFDPQAMLEDVLKRPFVTMWFLALLLLFPLALTSSQVAIRKLGGVRWQKLHRLVYLIGILAGAHYWFLSKGTALLWPAGYGLVLALLLVFRIKFRASNRVSAARS